MKWVLFLIISITMSFSGDIQKGRAVYLANCAMCHTVDGRGGLGPDFNMVSYRRHQEEIAAYAKDPYSLYSAFGYSANAMPTLPLEDDEFNNVAAYISTLVKFKKWMKK